MRRRLEIDLLLMAIQAEAECALRRANFTEHIEHIHRLVTVIENRIKDWEDQQRWTGLDRLMAKAAECDSLTLEAIEKGTQGME